MLRDYSSSRLLQSVLIVVVTVLLFACAAVVCAADDKQDKRDKQDDRWRFSIIPFETAGRYARFTQADIEWMTTSVGGSVVSDTKQLAGTSDINLAPMEPVSLKGVQYAAKRYVTYNLKGTKWQQGWVYAFTEPYQIFILYMASEKEGMKELADLKAILDSFEVVSKK